MGIITFRHSKPAGDLLAALAGIKKVCEDTDSKAIIVQRLGFKGIGFLGAIHPFQDEQGDTITMNKYMFDMLRPLIVAQDYIEDFIVYEGQEIDYDLDKSIQETFTNQPKGSLNRWLFYVYPQMSCDLSKAWITADLLERNYENIEFEKKSFIYYHDKIVITQTDRYKNHVINYFFLKKYEQHIVFSGLPNEHENFCKQWGLNVPLLEVNNFLELAVILKSCKFLLSNATMIFQIAEGLKIPRLLEICPMMPNVIPISENSYDFYHQSHCEFLFEKLFNL